MNYTYGEAFVESINGEFLKIELCQSYGIEILAEGDSVEIPDIFSYRVAKFRMILGVLGQRAIAINCTIHASTIAKGQDSLYPSTGSIKFELLKPAGNKRPEPPCLFNGSLSTLPKHRGEYYGCHEDIPATHLPAPGWNLVSIPFNQEEEETL